MRYCLMLLIVALAGAYYFALAAPYPGWLPPASPEELQALETRRLQSLSAAAQPTGLPVCQDCIDAGSVPHLDTGNATAPAYTACESPVSSGPPDIVDF
jgi:hypothetical protein